MKKKKDLDLAPSRRERKTLGQYILLFFLVLYTLFCALPIVLVFVAAFSDEKTIVQDRKSTRLNSSHNVASRMPSSA